MIYGWGTDNATKQVDDWTEVTCRYRYVTLMFIFSLVWNRRWFLHGRDRAMDREVTPEEIKQLFGPDAVPSPGLWRRFGVLLSVGAFVAVAAVSAAVGAITGDGGQTAAGDGAVAEPVGDLASEPVTEPSDATQDDPDATENLGDDDGTADNTTGGAEPQAGSAATAATGGTVEQVAESIVQVSESNLISTDPTDPTEEIGELTIDTVYSTDASYGGFTPEPGSKLVVIDVQLLVSPNTSIGAGASNLVEDVFRLVDDDGRIHQPVESWNELGFPGEVVNRSFTFEVPVDLAAFALEVGVTADQRDGYTARYEVTLVDGPIAAYLPPDTAVSEGAVTATLTSESAVGEADPSIPYSRLPASAVDYTVLDGQTAARIGPDSADPGHKWLILNLQVEGVTIASNLKGSALRVSAGGERYSPVNDINLFIQAGEVADVQAVFQIPAGAQTATLELGSPEGWIGERATYDLALP